MNRTHEARGSNPLGSTKFRIQNARRVTTTPPRRSRFSPGPVGAARPNHSSIPAQNSMCGRRNAWCYRRRMLPEPARRLVEAGRLVHLVTINPDCSPQVSIVWAGVEDDCLLVGSLGSRRKLSNVERDPRVALSIETAGDHGMRDYLVLHGIASITAGGAPELLQKLARVYLGPGVKFPPMDDPPPGFVMRITVNRVGGHGPWSRDKAASTVQRAFDENQKGRA